MKTLERVANRRSMLVGSVAVAAAWMVRPFFKPVAAQQPQAGITAAQVDQLPSEPEDRLWERATAAHISLNPQNIVVPRLKEAGAKAISVRALYDGERLGFLLEWDDAHKDVDLGTVLQYRDAVALQFPEDPSQPTPSFTMGQKGNGVIVYHWKSDWQFGRVYDVDEAYPNMYGDWYQLSGVPAGKIPEAKDYLTAGNREYLTAAAAGNALADPLAQEKIGPVQKMRAEGFGTIEPDVTQDGKGKGMWRDGVWRIAISVPRKQARFIFEEGMVVPVGFAVWDGSRSERNGQKAYSFWNNASLGAPSPAAAPAGGGAMVPVLGTIGGVVAAAIATLVAVRLWRGRRQQGRPDQRD